MRPISFTIPMAPKGQARKRVAAFKGRPQLYTDRSEVEYLRDLRHWLAPHAPATPITGPVGLVVDLFFPVPKHAPRGKPKDWLDMARAEQVRHTKKPDEDNCAKLLRDAMNGWFYVDDSQVADCMGRKRYSSNPRWEVCLRELDEYLEIVV